MEMEANKEKRARAFHRAGERGRSVEIGRGASRPARRAPVSEGGGARTSIWGARPHKLVRVFSYDIGYGASRLPILERVKAALGRLVRSRRSRLGVSLVVSALGPVFEPTQRRGLRPDARR